MTDNVKRHVVVGIALNNVLVPQLRAVIDHDLKGLYDNLVTKHKINTNKNDLFTPETHGFSYRDAGNDFIVSSHDELAKLFMKKEMVKFKRITDPTFDGSAALNVIEKASCFSSAVRDAAKKIRQKLRNPWAHCNSDEWKNNKFLTSFKLMEELVTALSKQPTTKSFDKATILRDLKAWEVDGLKLMGNNVDPALLKRIFDEHHKVMKALVEENVEIEKFKAQQTTIEEAVEKVKQKLGVVEAEQITMKADIDKNAEKIAKMEKSSQKRETQRFNPPAKNKCFTGREEQLQTITTVLQEGSSPVVTIRGLGGVGKTTLALEAACRMAEKGNFPGGVYWLTADSDTGDATLKASLFGLAWKIGEVSADADGERMADVVTSHLIEQGKCLLVIDNLDSEDFSPLVNKLVNGMWLQQNRESEVAMLIEAER